MADTQSAPEAFSQQTIDGIAVPKGIILPPPEVRSIVEKTAGYVARNSRAFEARIREKEKTNAKFSFINEDDPYFLYYSWRVHELETGGPSLDGTNSTHDTTNGPKAVNGENKGQINNGSGGSEAGFAKPPPLEFSYKLPPISAQDLDIIKLTALYVARNGSLFLHALSRAESKNFQYDFLKHTHSLYPLFNQLVEQYKKVINPQPILLDRIKQGQSTDYTYSIVNRARLRAEWAVHEAAETEKAAKAAETERQAYAAIDWHDFVVVETIKFTEADERANLPPPLSKAQLEYASLEQKRMSSLRLEEAPPDFDEQETREAVDRSLEEQQRKTRLQTSHPDSLPKIPQGPESSVASIPQKPSDNTQPQQNNPLPPGMKIRMPGTSRRNKMGAAGGAGTEGPGSYGGINEPMVESPLTGERIPQSQLEEHMRITLLDPKWKEQKTIADARRSTTNLSTSEVAANIKRLASHLHNDNETDNVDGYNGGKHGRDDTDGPPRKKQAAEVQWDGYSGTKHQAMRQAAAQTSAQSIQEAKRREMERLNRIGPKPKN